MAQRLFTILGVVLAMVVWSADAQARSNRVDHVPNGSQFRCDVCHTEAGGLNDFGFDAFAYLEGNGVVDWSQLAMIDSDRDGYSNGLELGDPNGTWRRGDANPGGAVTNPGIRADNFCGNGTMEPNEDCDLGQTSTTCGELGLGAGGSVSCGDLCVWDTTQCGTCGDGLLNETTEECDGSALGGATCDFFGFDGGTIGCASDCTLDTSACIGNGQVLDPTANPGGPDCGNGVRSLGEQCDGSDMGGATCETFSLGAGVLRCSNRCTFDSGGCGQAISIDRPSVSTPGSISTSPPVIFDATGAEPIVVEMDGYACSTGTSRSPSSALMLMLVGLLAGWRRRRRA